MSDPQGDLQERIVGRVRPMLEALARAQEFTIPGTLPCLNEYIREQRANKFGGARAKAEATEMVQQVIMAAKLEPMETPLYIIFSWYMPNAKKDIDGVRFACKFILDALVLQGVIPDDSQRYVKSLSDNFYVDRANPRIVVALIVAPSKVV